MNPPKRQVFVDSLSFEEPNRRGTHKKSTTPRRATTKKPKANRKFEYLDPRQLLKHALSLATQRRGRFCLIYLYCDWTGESKTVSTISRSPASHRRNALGQGFLLLRLGGQITQAP